MIILIKLLFAHFIGDFVFQPKSWVDNKAKNKIKSPYLYSHILIHGLLTLLVLWNFDNWLLPILILVSHFFIDLSKLYFQNESNKAKWFFIDQGLHLIAIIVIWSIMFKPDLNFVGLFSSIKLWIYTTAILLITIVAGIMMREFMSIWSKDFKDSNDESLSSAGMYIGILERLFIFVFVITSNWEAIGFLLAAKSVFRFGDLKEGKERKLTEYILIGTLLSFGIAIAIGMTVLKLEENV